MIKEWINSLHPLSISVGMALMLFIIWIPLIVHSARLSHLQAEITRWEGLEEKCKQASYFHRRGNGPKFSFRFFRSRVTMYPIDPCGFCSQLLTPRDLPHDCPGNGRFQWLGYW